MFIGETIETLRMDLTVGGKSLAEVKILISIFQGDALSQLIFIIVMVPLTHILKWIETS